MRILLDLIPLKRGGGVQVGLTLIEQVESSQGMGHEWLALVSAGSGIDQRLVTTEHCRTVWRVPPGHLARARFERKFLHSIVEEYKPDALYTQFGPGLPQTGTVAVVGSAYSNLYYPEIDFWGNWPIAQRSLYRLRDVFRLRRTLQADALIFETDQLAERAAKLYSWPRERMTVVRPAPSPLLHLTRANADLTKRCKQLPPGFRVLLLSGWHMNKGLEIIPRVAQEIRTATGRDDFVFVLTVPETHPRSQRMKDEAVRYGVDGQIVFFGPVAAADCAELYQNTQAVLLLSVLESFSNNIIEAWAMKRPLVITDAEWSRNICGDAAEYVDRADPRAIASALVTLSQDSARVQRRTAAGCRMLEEYPTPQEKLAQYVAFLERMVELGPRSRHASAVRNGRSSTVSA